MNKKTLILVSTVFLLSTACGNITSVPQMEVDKVAVVEDKNLKQSDKQNTIDDVISKYLEQKFDFKAIGGVVFEAHELYGVEKKDDKTYAYIWSVQQEYKYTDGKLENGAGLSIPLVLVMNADRDNKYTVLEYKAPKDGEQYASSIKEMFPKEYHEKILTRTNSAELEEIVKQKAQNYFISGSKAGSNTKTTGTSDPANTPKSSVKDGDIQKGMGIYTGLIDGNSIEVKLIKSSGEAEAAAFRFSDKVRPAFDKLALKTGDKIEFEYTTNGYEQNILMSINKSAADTRKNEPDKNKIISGFKALMSRSPQITEVAKFLDSNIEFASTSDAVSMVVEFEKAQRTYLSKLEEKYYKGGIQEKFIKEYSKDFDINSIYGIKDTDLKKLLDETKAAGYRVETAEGMFFPIINYEFYKKYKPYLTLDLKEYVDIMAKESNKVPAKDAALVIGFDEVLQRAQIQEEFINRFKDSLKQNDVKELYKKYLIFSLFGCNNTPLFSYDTKLMPENTRTQYKEFINKNQGNSFTEIIKGFMDVVEKSNYKLTDLVEKYRNNQI
ncbi:hypothetical protein [Pseudobacteroides cellulosolvens]|uniref:DUF4825 domain-containing protein n=1 Tax=Pseudobacteroides cellulosolvens ATCC 35603 = DSM 2933 TaxID=398512 RepID=A0A0L6JRI7_9FIRM|nr:hypothetical protein [Pseudobacteroides cellulosolvens]KNY28295.1 hypothetical protein Bccel_3569 [Pseudobacteroides cellulosolvens ATCC 35603 = DSM 2933]